MKTRIFPSAILLAAFSLPVLAQNTAPAQKEVSFKADVRTILDDYCMGCHVPGGKGFEKSGLDLRTYQSLMKGTKFGPVITPGSSLTSTLNVLVSGHADPAISMPFGIKGGLPKDKVDLLNKWVNQGAKNN
jgi:hypothetical protein